MINPSDFISDSEIHIGLIDLTEIRLKRKTNKFSFLIIIKRLIYNTV